MHLHTSFYSLKYFMLQQIIWKIKAKSTSEKAKVIPLTHSCFLPLSLLPQYYNTFQNFERKKKGNKDLPVKPLCNPGSFPERSRRGRKNKSKTEIWNTFGCGLWNRNPAAAVTAKMRIVVVAQLVERSLPTQEGNGSNQAIGKLYMYILLTALKRK